MILPPRYWFDYYDKDNEICLILEGDVYTEEEVEIRKYRNCIVDCLTEAVDSRYSTCDYPDARKFYPMANMKSYPKDIFGLVYYVSRDRITITALKALIDRAINITTIALEEQKERKRRL